MGTIGFLKSSLKNSTSATTLSLLAGLAIGTASIEHANARSVFGDVGAAFHKATGDAGRAVEKGTHDTGNAIEKGTHDTGNAIEKGTHDTGSAIEKGTHDTGNAIEKGTHDTGYAIEKGAQDTGVAAATVVRFAGRELQGVSLTLTDAAKRIREGKVIDAIWHAATDPLKHTEANAAKAAQESDILRTVGQVAASVYGGPGGAAAYAAWYAYRMTGDADFALRVGVLAGVTSAAFGEAGKIPTKQLAEKVIVTGAIGGLGVAAGGGNADAVKDGFLRAGGMVLLQAGYEEITRHPVDAHSSKGEGYCNFTENADCSAPPEAYKRDAAGNILHDEKGRPLVDVTKEEASRPHVGVFADAKHSSIIDERSVFMTTVSRIPGMNAMALFHDVWTDDWHMSGLPMVATIAPATVLTYGATDGPYQMLLLENAMRNSRNPTDHGS